MKCWRCQCVTVDRHTANAIWAFRLGQDQLFLLESDYPIASGEANIASSSFDGDGSLQIAFHRRSFSEKGATRRAAQNAARVVDDVCRDAIESFQYPQPSDHLLNSADIPILLEGTDDNLEFTELVRRELLHLNPGMHNPVQPVASLGNASELEITRYIEGGHLDWSMEQRQALLESMAASGARIEKMDLVQAFQEVRVIQLIAGQVLVEAHAPAGFVYIPLGDGLKVIPLGGYAPFQVHKWMPLGSTGVIRGAARNADVVAEQAVELLMIPQEVFLKYWFRPYTVKELRRLFMG